VKRGERLVVGLSGGVDSVVLLDVLVRLRARLQVTVTALHVDHQLSPHHKEWARFCRALCKALEVPCRVVPVTLQAGNSLERAARDARYGAFRATRAQHVVLAHNKDDQAETVLLQLLRGAGVKGLAAMPLVRLDAIDSTSRSRTILRPLLDVARSDIVAYATHRKLDWIEDESNVDQRYLRNWVRHDVLPRFAARAPAYRDAFSRAARHAGEAAGLLDALARIDAAHVLEGDALRVEKLRAFDAPRARNLLRFLISERGWRMPDADRLEEALRQALSARRDAQLRVELGDCELRRHGTLIYVLPARATSTTALPLTWRGEREVPVPCAGGVLSMMPAHGDGISAARLAEGEVTIRGRAGGERLQVREGARRRTVKNLLQEARMPPWQRERVPFIYCGDALACIPGVAVDWRFVAIGGEPSIRASWKAEDGAAGWCPRSLSP
jgi:tRNA(Ile)-lysidine synthase